MFTQRLRQRVLIPVLAVGACACGAAKVSQGNFADPQGDADGILGGLPKANPPTKQYVKYRVIGCRAHATGQYVPPPGMELIFGDRWVGVRAIGVVYSTGGGLPEEFNNTYSEGGSKHFFAYAPGGQGWEFTIPLVAEKTGTATLNYYSAGGYKTAEVSRSIRVSGVPERECEMLAVWSDAGVGSTTPPNVDEKIAEYRARSSGSESVSSTTQAPVAAATTPVAAIAAATTPVAAATATASEAKTPSITTNKAGSAAVPSTGSRFALVIGNGAYASTPLRNPPKDARLVARALQQVGFEVTLHTDLVRDTMKRAINSFNRRLMSDGVALFYFAGHGVQVNGRNYLIPVDANITAENEIDIEGVDVSRVLSGMETSRTRVNILILDACRNNPFVTSARSASRGLAFAQAPSGTLIAYATSPGSVAADGADTNSPYSTALAKHLTVPGLSVESVFKAVRKDVQAGTTNAQTPWESSSLTGDFSFVE